jgi:tRNA U34 2-thiouridine synthase MnmA/TrmU
MARALVMLSGGLDSTLVVRLLVDLGVQVEAVHFTSPFCRCTPASWGCSAAHRAAEGAGITVHMVACREEYLEVVKRPRFGRGSRMNPCLDCRIFMFSRTRELMARLGADFVATGEVLGQRPMSQRRDTMDLIDRESGLAGLVVRPLCARLLPPSVPEEKGWIDRTKLLAFQGRSRRPQMELAAARGVRDYPCPAGGCLLNDPEFAGRFKDLLEWQPDFGLADARLLKWGRHFRLESGAKVVVGRDEAENGLIDEAAREGDVRLAPASVPGPSALCLGKSSDGDVATAATLVATFTKSPGPVEVRIKVHGAEAAAERMISATPMSRSWAERWRVGAKRTTSTNGNVPSERKGI